MTRKTLKKGLMKDAAQKLDTGDLLDLQIEPGFISSTFNRLQTNKHLISMVKCSKQATTSFDNSAYYKDCGYCNIPFFCDIVNIGKCTSLDCKRYKMLASIWRRILIEK